MLDHKQKLHGVSHGLAEAGYDIRIKQDIVFVPAGEYYSVPPFRSTQVADHDLILVDGKVKKGRFTIASSVEQFFMPTDLVGLVKDKSTWARRGLSVFNTVIEPGWGRLAECFLTLELVYHGPDKLHIPAGCGIAQVLFEVLEETAVYDGKYRAQPDRPVEAIHEKD